MLIQQSPLSSQSHSPSISTRPQLFLPGEFKFHPRRRARLHFSYRQRCPSRLRSPLTHSLRLSSSPASLDTRRVTWTFQIGVSTPLSTSLFFSYFFPSPTPAPTLLTIFQIFFFPSVFLGPLSVTISNLLTLAHIFPSLPVPSLHKSPSIAAVTQSEIKLPGSWLDKCGYEASRAVIRW